MCKEIPVCIRDVPVAVITALQSAVNDDVELNKVKV